MRQLIYIPVIHTQVDMGSMADALKKSYLDRHGEEKWASRVKAIDQMWEGIQRKIEELNLDCHRVKLYQDGLPICDKEIEIVNEVASRGSHNYQILKELLQKGCTLMGTESPELLIKEYQMIKEAAQSKGKNRPFLEKLRLWLAARKILRDRDQFIAQRIVETLQDEETGILFMGIHHQVDRYLTACRGKTNSSTPLTTNPHGITIRYLFHRLPFEYNRRFSASF